LVWSSKSLKGKSNFSGDKASGKGTSAICWSWALASATAAQQLSSVVQTCVCQRSDPAFSGWQERHFEMKRRNVSMRKSDNNVIELTFLYVDFQTKSCWNTLKIDCGVGENFDI
jgi:hypothetical protein